MELGGTLELEASAVDATLHATRTLSVQQPVPHNLLLPFTFDDSTAARPEQPLDCEPHLVASRGSSFVTLSGRETALETLAAKLRLGQAAVGQVASFWAGGWIWPFQGMQVAFGVDG